MKKVVFELNNRYKLGIQLDNGKILNSNCTGTYRVDEIPREKLIVFDSIEELIDEIKSKYDEKIIEELSKLRTVTGEEKEAEFKEHFNEVMQRITVNCERFLQSEDDSDRWNRLKEIENLKKQLYSGECLGDLADEVHRYNGKVKYRIKCLKDDMKKDIDELKANWVKNFISD